MRDINERSFFSKRTASKKGSLFKSQKIIVSKLKKPTMKTHNIQVKEEEKSHIFEEPKEDIDNSNNIQSNYQSSLKKSTNCTDSSDEGLSPKNINKKQKALISKTTSQGSLTKQREDSDSQISKNEILPKNQSVSNIIKKNFCKEMHKYYEERSNLNTKMNIFKENLKFLEMEKEEENSSNLALNEKIKKLKKKIDEITIKIQDITFRIENKLKEQSNKTSKQNILSEYMKVDRKEMRKKMSKIMKENEEFAAKRENLILENEKKEYEEQKQLIKNLQEEKQKEIEEKKSFHKNQLEVVSKLHAIVQEKILTGNLQVKPIKKEQYLYYKNANLYNFQQEKEIRKVNSSRKLIMKSVNTEELEEFADKINTIQQELEKKRKQKTKLLKLEWKERAESLPSNQNEKVFISKGNWLKLGKDNSKETLEINKKEFCERIKIQFQPKVNNKLKFESEEKLLLNRNKKDFKKLPKKDLTIKPLNLSTNGRKKVYLANSFENNYERKKTSDIDFIAYTDRIGRV